MEVMTESELETPFAVMVNLPVVFINYRDIEVSISGIEAEVREETSVARKERLLKIRGQLKRILNEL